MTNLRDRVMATADSVTGKLPALHDAMRILDYRSTSEIQATYLRLERDGLIVRTRDKNGRVLPGTTYLAKAWVKVPVRGTLDGSGIHLD